MISTSATTSNKTVSGKIKIASLTGCFILLFLLSIHLAIIAALYSASVGAFFGFLFTAGAASLAGAWAIEFTIDILTKS